MISKTLFRMLVLGCALSFVVLPPVSARGRGGAVFIGGGFGGFGYYDPFWGAYPYPAYDQSFATGTVKFDTNNKDSAVYIEGGYAGTVGELKNLHLRPGTYNIELRPASSPAYTSKIYVGAGKTVHVNPSQQP